MTKGGGNGSKYASYFVQIMVTNSCTVGEMQTTEEQEEAVL